MIGNYLVIGYCILVIAFNKNQTYHGYCQNLIIKKLILTSLLLY